MAMYATQGTIAAATGITVLLLVLAATGRNPLAVLARGARHLWQDRRNLAGLAGVLLVLVVNWLENRWESAYPHLVSWDLTDEVAWFGGAILTAFQYLEWPPLTHLLVYVYVMVFPAMGLASLVVYSAAGDRGALARLFRAFFLIYLVALPFYLYFPVLEAWAGSHGAVRFLIPQVYPAFEAQYRPLSGLDNCFPSLHTALAVTYTLVALRSGYSGFGALLSVLAGLVMLSTLYLGVHWPVDMVGGVILAAFASGCATVRRPVPVPGLRLPPA